MKKQWSIVAISLIMVTVVVFSAFAQHKNKDKKDHQPQKEKHEKHRGNNDSDKPGKAGKEKNDKAHKQGNNKHDHAEPGKDKNNRSSDNDVSDDKGKMKDGYKWDKETFKDRKKYKDQEKVTICHKVNRNGEPPVSIRVSANALKAHLAHGDVEGDCAGVNNNQFSNVFLKRRTDYYNVLQTGQEQVVYSRSILDYALQRLTNARSQLLLLQRNNAPQAEIERKQAVIVELEQNTSLLQQLLGVAANLIVNKLSQ